jgi:hypothetical protein
MLSASNLSRKKTEKKKNRKYSGDETASFAE